jgi:hypothetical protein
MPFYPALPEFRPVTPFSNLVTGLSAGMSMSEKIANARLKNEALNEAQAKQQALKTYQQSGDVNALIPAMTPAQAFEAKEGAQLRQIDLGLKAGNYFDKVKHNLTQEGYPVFRQDIINKFGKMAENYFPPPEQLDTPEKFEGMKWGVDEKLANFRALPQVIAAQSRMQEGALNRQSHEGIATARIQSRENVAAANIASRDYGTAIRERGQQNRKIDTFAYFITDPEIAKLPRAEQVKRYNGYVAEGKETPAQRQQREASAGRTTVLTDKDKANLEILRTLIPKDAADTTTGQTFPVLNKRTGKTDYVTKEQYDQIIGK